MTAGSTIVFLSEIAGLAPFNGSGVKDFHANASGAGINTISGRTIVGPQAQLQMTFIRDASLRIDGLATILPDGSASAVSSVANLEITGGAVAPVGTLDLNDNDLIATATSRSLVEAQIVHARHGGLWDRPGITSSAARSEPMRLTMLGVLSGAEYKSVYGLSATFDGFAVANSDVLVKYTLYGDSDFNDRIDGADYARIDTGFNDLRSGWINGDFDLNGKVDGADYALIDISFNAQSGTLPIMLSFLDGTNPDRGGMQSDPALRIALLHFDRFGESYAIAAMTSIPEPASALLVGGIQLCSSMVLRRRRWGRGRAPLNAESSRC